MNERDIRAAEEAGDQDAVTALNEDNARLRSVEAQLRRANDLAQQGNQAAADRIIERVDPILQEEAGRRAAFDFTPPQPGPIADRGPRHHLWRGPRGRSSIAA